MFPKTGNVFPAEGENYFWEGDYASAIATALQEELGDTHRAVKTVMRWTGASERTAKNWFAGTRGPSGEHLVLLLRHSDAVLHVLLRMSARTSLFAAENLAAPRATLVGSLGLIHPA